MTRAALAILCSLTLVGAPARALEDDRKQPVNIRAASVQADEKTGLAVYTGKVVMTQGSLHVNADRVEVRAARADRRVQRITATGKPARLRVVAKPDAGEIVAYAERMVYDADKREVDLSGDVRVQQGGDEFRAARAHYLLDANRLTAQAGDNGRVSAVLQPRAKKP